jgi:hypothetical protein
VNGVVSAGVATAQQAEYYSRRMLTGIIPGEPTIIATLDPPMDVASPSTSSSTCESQFELKIKHIYWGEMRSACLLADLVHHA